MRGEHLAVRVDVDAAPRRLFEQQPEVAQVVARHDDEGPRLDGEADTRRLRRAEALGVRVVEQLHAAQVDLAGLEDERQKLVHRVGLRKRRESFEEEAVHLSVAVAEHRGVIRVGRHAAQAEEYQRLERAYVLVRLPDFPDVVCRRIVSELFTRLAHTRRKLRDGRAVEVHVRHRREEPFEHQPRAALRRSAARRAGERNQLASQPVLKLRGIRRLPAYSHIAHAAAASRRLLALKTKHFSFHDITPPLFRALAPSPEFPRQPPR